MQNKKIYLVYYTSYYSINYNEYRIVKIFSSIDKVNKYLRNRDFEGDRLFKNCNFKNTDTFEKVDKSGINHSFYIDEMEVE